MRSLRTIAISPIALAPMLALVFAGGTQARTIRCDAGDVDCLTDAIVQANANGRTKNTIRLAAGTYTLQSVNNQTDGPNGLPSITSTLTIAVDGPGTAILTRASDTPFRLIHVAASGNLTLRGAIVSNGALAGSGTNRGDCLHAGEHDGGGLFNRGGIVAIEDTTFTRNGAFSGGGLVNQGGSVTVKNSTFADNGADGAGAICNNGSLTIHRSVVEGGLALAGPGLVSSGGEVRISRSRFTHNVTPSGAFGAIWLTGGTAWIDETSIDQNFSDSTAAGISVGATASLTISNSAFVGNDSTSGGSALTNAGTVEVINTTFANNRGAIRSGAGTTILNSGTLTLINSTLRNPRIASSASVQPILGSMPNATTILQNTLFSQDPADSLQDCGGVVVSRGNNLLSHVTGCVIAIQPSDLITDARLNASLVDDGQPGHEHFALMATSPAINAGNEAVCSPKDQIGHVRRGPCDIGSIEFRKRDALNDQDDQ